jgi:hypothetical protein
MMTGLPRLRPHAPRLTEVRFTKLWFRVLGVGLSSAFRSVGAPVHVGQRHQRDLARGRRLAQVVVEAGAAEQSQCGVFSPGSEQIPDVCQPVRLIAVMVAFSWWYAVSVWLSTSSVPEPRWIRFSGVHAGNATSR